MSRFQDKIVLITGGSAGIGLGIAKRFGIEGATVVISGRKQAKLNDASLALTKLNIKHYIKQSHAGKESSIKELIEFTVKKCNKIDILIPNAATNPYFGNFLKAEVSHWDKTFEVNLRGPFLLCKYGVPYMKKGGSIIFNASIGGYKLDKGNGIYGILKTGIIAMTKVLASELGSKGIRVNCVAPGIIPTKFSKVLVETKSIRNKLVGETILKRVGTVDEIAGVFAFLGSNDAGYITGETIVAAGGTQSRL